MAWFCIFTLSVRSNTEGKAVGSAAVQSQELNKPVRICQNTTSAHDNAQITSLTLTFKDQLVELATHALKSLWETCVFSVFIR